jgi:hypothetical protein
MMNGKNMLLPLGVILSMWSTLLGQGLNVRPYPILEGVSDAKVEVTAKLLPKTQEVTKLEEYLKRGGNETTIQVIELSSGTPYWLDYMSSMGANSRKALKEWVLTTMLKSHTIAEEQGPKHIEEEPSLLSSYCGGANKSQLQEGVTAISELVGSLSGEYGDSVAIDRPFYATSFKICPFSQKVISFFIVETKPHSGPDTKTYLVVIESLYEE